MGNVHTFVTESVESYLPTISVPHNEVKMGVPITRNSNEPSHFPHFFAYAFDEQKKSVHKAERLEVDKYFHSETCIALILVKLVGKVHRHRKFPEKKLFI